jgi:hypothetical protein
MRKFILFIFYFFVVLSTGSPLFSQDKIKKKISVSAGMGIDYLSMPSYVEYLRSDIPGYNSDSIKTFSTGVEFFGTVEYGLSKNISASLDYSYFLKSNTYNYSYFVFDYTITAHQPGIMVYYNLIYPGVRFKIGAGGGYHFYTLENNISENNKDTYKASGGSVRFELIFAPALSKNLSAYVSAFLSGNFTSTLKNENGEVLKSSSSGKEVNLGSYGPGGRIGFTVNLN